jgi:hypothetical protein
VAIDTDGILMSPILIAGIVIGALFVVWVLLNLKTSRPDGRYIGRVHPYRRVLWFIMPDANGSVVYFDEYIDAEPILDYLEQTDVDCNITHCIVAAAAMGFAENPAMNHFIKGYRLYERDGIHLSFSMKRKKKDKKAKLSAVKLHIAEGMTFADLCEQTNAFINRERSGKKTYADKEFDLLTAMPRAVFHRAVKLLKQLDYYNLVPGSFIANDPMYTSMFIANLGSVDMGAGFHHLYEWGTCPLFMMVGKIEEKPWIVDGEIVKRKIMHVRFTYDERIDDGLTAGYGIRTFKEVMLDPHTHLGCLESDGSDAWDLTVPRDQRPYATAAAAE